MATVVARNADEAVVVSVVKYAGVCVGAFGRNLASVAVKM
jgi:hypothetical protein